MIVPKNRISLNKTEYSVRSSQLILQNGTGSMIDFSGQTLMVAAPEYWDPSGKKMETIHDERLEKQLHVSKFRGFPREDREEKIFPSVAYVRFPEWYFCPSCRRFQPIEEWKKEYLQKASKDTISKDPDMNQVRNLCCLNPQCKRMIFHRSLLSASVIKDISVISHGSNGHMQRTINQFVLLLHCICSWITNQMLILVFGCHVNARLVLHLLMPSEKMRSRPLMKDPKVRITCGAAVIIRGSIFMNDAVCIQEQFKREALPRISPMCSIPL